MMNRQIRVEKIIGTVKCVATCGAIKIQAVDMSIRLPQYRYSVKTITITIINFICKIFISQVHISTTVNCHILSYNCNMLQNYLWLAVLFIICLCVVITEMFMQGEYTQRVRKRRHSLGFRNRKVLSLPFRNFEQSPTLSKSISFKFTPFLS